MSAADGGVDIPVDGGLEGGLERASARELDFGAAYGGGDFPANGGVDIPTDGGLKRLMSGHRT